MALDESKLSPVKTGSFSSSFEAALRQLKRATSFAIRGGAMASMLAVGPGAGLVGCAGGEEGPAALDPLLDPGAADGWLDSEGQRNTDMVRYMDSSWHEYSDCNNRGGCMAVAVFLKVQVQRVEGSDLSTKRVGVVYTSPGGDTRTAVGSYFSTLNDGWEEWHVRIDRRAYETGVIRFDAWYQDGRGNTFYDDNAGEGHVEAYTGRHAVVYQVWNDQAVTVGDDGVQGMLEVMVADLDYDKDLRLVWTTDGWATTNEFAIGDSFQPNNFYWVEDAWSGYERWAIDLDIEGPVDRFEYAVVYAHGVVNDAERYEFWDNNGGYNHVINRSQ